jgi:hypothetical protein
MERAEHNQTPCTLQTPAGSAAHRVLTLVNLPVDTDI